MQLSPGGAPLNFGFSGRQCSGPACGCDAVHGASAGAADLGPGGATGADSAGTGVGSAAGAVSGPDLEVKLEPGAEGGAAGAGMEIDPVAEAAAGAGGGAKGKRDRSRGQSLEASPFAAPSAPSGSAGAEARQVPRLPPCAGGAASGSAAELHEITERDTRDLRALLGPGWAAPAGMPRTQELQHSTWPSLEGKKQRVGSGAVLGIVRAPAAKPPLPNLPPPPPRSRDVCCCGMAFGPMTDVERRRHRASCGLEGIPGVELAKAADAAAEGAHPGGVAALPHVFATSAPYTPEPPPLVEPSAAADLALGLALSASQSLRLWKWRRR